MYHMIAQLVLAVVILTWHFSLGGRYPVGCQRDAIHAYMYKPHVAHSFCLSVTQYGLYHIST